MRKTGLEHRDNNFGMPASPDFTQTVHEPKRAETASQLTTFHHAVT